jgi:hypothetical protein
LPIFSACEGGTTFFEISQFELMRETIIVEVGPVLFVFEFVRGAALFGHHPSSA